MLRMVSNLCKDLMEVQSRCVSAFVNNFLQFEKFDRISIFNQINRYFDLNWEFKC